MDPNTAPQPSFDLPQLSPETAGSPNMPGTPEKIPIPEVQQASQAAPAQTPPQVPPAMVAPPLPFTDPQGHTPAVAVPSLPAADIDLIEKEWVLRAKAIVDKTKNDPHAQNKELNKIKAEYIKKRYNKDLKVKED